MKQKVSIFFLQNLEAIIWISVLLTFTFSTVNTGHITICPFKIAGIDNCPGCGLGRSLIMLLHGDLIQSFEMHPFALLTFVLLLIRIVTVIRKSILYQKQIKWID
jgi:hypothetical protein